MLQIYNTISDKCVGNLLSARKHGFVSFEGEMLYQVRGKLFFLFSVFFFFLLLLAGILYTFLSLINYYPKGYYH
jgi:hypothetical protein